MKFGFVTCVQLGLSCIEKIYELGGRLDLLITLKDEKAKKKSGRIFLDKIAKENNATLIKVDHINDKETIEAIKSSDLDWLFIIGWSQIASKEVLSAVRYGCVGMHPTLLPEGRGRAAIPWAIIKGLDKTGVTMFKLDEGVDTGDILGQTEIPIDSNTTATQLYRLVEQAHSSLMENVFPKMMNDEILLVKQDDKKATYWEGRKPGDGELFKSMTISEADKLIRATTHPYPGAFYSIGDEKIIVWSASFVTELNDELMYFELVDGYLIPNEFEVLSNS